MTDEYIPTQDELNDKLWRLTHLYYITNKSGEEVLFDLNWAQKELFHKEWHQMLVLKARQLGVTTYFSINFLDDCFWHGNTHAGIIAHRREDAEDIFKKKVKYAYDRMPRWTRTFNSATNDRSGELAFKNGQVIECLQDFDLELISDSLFLSSVKSVLSPPTLLKRLSQEHSTLSAQIKSLQLNLQLKGEKDTFTNIAKEQKN